MEFSRRQLLAAVPATLGVSLAAGAIASSTSTDPTAERPLQELLRREYRKPWEYPGV